MVNLEHTTDRIYKILSGIPDPEIPVVSIVEMGMVRDVVTNDDGYTIVITPTYSGCPAMGIITADIKMMLEKNGITRATVSLVYDPAWTTDWMSDIAKEKLRAYGIAPPLHSSCSLDTFAHNIIACPRCASDDTVLISRFGATACKSLYQCNNCKEPFEYFKCH